MHMETVMVLIGIVLIIWLIIYANREKKRRSNPEELGYEKDTRGAAFLDLLTTLLIGIWPLLLPILLILVLLLFVNLF